MLANKLRRPSANSGLMPQALQEGRVSGFKLGIKGLWFRFRAGACGFDISAQLAWTRPAGRVRAIWVSVEVYKLDELDAARKLIVVHSMSSKTR